jgi:hypothetical protein
MSRRIRPRTTVAENFKQLGHTVPWRLFLLIPFLLVFAVPAFLLGTGAGHKILPNLTTFFSNIANPTPTVLTTPLPRFSTILPQAGALNYTVQNSDSCDEILSNQMRMTDAGLVFSDVKPGTVKALSAAMGKNCGDLQPGETVALMPQYPLVELGGIVMKVEALSPAQPIPTPLIPVQAEQKLPGVDCSNGCRLTVHMANSTVVDLSVETAIPVPVGAWVWAQAFMPRQNIKDFSNYPYADPNASLNGAAFTACDFQVNDTHDDNSSTCDQLMPNTIDDDGGAWLFGVTGSNGIDHWHYNLHQPSGTRMLIWLSVDSHGYLHYHPGNPIYKYDAAQSLYVKA